jgi:hypothetical protein
VIEQCRGLQLVQSLADHVERYAELRGQRGGVAAAVAGVPHARRISAEAVCPLVGPVVDEKLVAYSLNEEVMRSPQRRTHIL